MDRKQWRQVRWMFASILLLHIIGFGVFVAFVVPEHYKGLGIGVSVLAYTLGLRHAFDADHISGRFCPLRPQQGRCLRGARFRRRVHCHLPPGDFQHRPHPLRPPLRALSQSRTRQPAGH
jgi:hypothetical protein